MKTCERYGGPRFIMSYIAPLLWEDGDFMDVFCSGCPLSPGPYEDCPAGNDPRCSACRRHGLAESIEQSFEDVAAEMTAWGCGR